MPRKNVCLGLVCSLTAFACTAQAAAQSGTFTGRYFSGQGDTEYLQLLDTARRMFSPDPEYQNLSMLYMPRWNGLVEGPTWDAWWIQNSYGTTLAGQPFYEEPFVTFLQNSHDLWFDQMGDGKRVGASKPFDWVAPDGALCDAARPGWIVYKQGDGRTAIHDWGMEFTAAGVVMQAESLLISRDVKAIEKYLPKLRRCVNFIETRRDPKTNLFLAGPAGNLLAPGFAGWKKPDGTYGQAYLAGLSVTYIAGLDRMIELEKLAGHAEEAEKLRARRESARAGLSRLTTDEGYLICSLDPDGTRHGVYGAAKHGYFESSPNHDAIALRVADDAQAEKIYNRIASIPGLRPYDFIIPNYPSYDDMYEKAEGLWAFGTWVNGGHWSTCEARMVLAYYRLGKFEDARRSMKRLIGFANRWRMDNPLTKFGSELYQPNQPINLCYDSFGPAAALIRGLFEYQYKADRLVLVPHIPPRITRLEQRFPIRFGSKRLYLSTVGSGPVTSVTVNGREWREFDAETVTLAYSATPERAEVVIRLGEGTSDGGESVTTAPSMLSAPGAGAPSTLNAAADSKLPSEIAQKRARLDRFHRALMAAGMGQSYEASHAALAIACIDSIAERQRLRESGNIPTLPEPARSAAEKCYADSANNLFTGLETLLKGYAESPDANKRRAAELWTK
jgi:hypothetical protein